MAPSIWYYPAGAPLKRIGLSQDFSEIAESEARDEVSHESISGRRVTITYSSRVTVRVTSELITDQDDALELEALCNHLRRNGTIAVAERSTHTLGAFARYVPERGDDGIGWYSNMFANFGGAYTADVGDVLHLRGPSPRMLRESVAVASSQASGAGLSTAIRHDWGAERWCFVHNKRFWPLLRLRAGRNNDQLLRSFRRIHYTLDLELEEVPNALERVSKEPGATIQGEDEEQGIDLTMEHYDRPPSSTGYEGLPIGPQSEDRLSWWRR
jgi:hypothetical protein